MGKQLRTAPSCCRLLLPVSAKRVQVSEPVATRRKANRRCDGLRLTRGARPHSTPCSRAFRPCPSSSRPGCQLQSAAVVRHAHVPVSSRSFVGAPVEAIAEVLLTHPRACTASWHCSIARITSLHSPSSPVPYPCSCQSVPGSPPAVSFECEKGSVESEAGAGGGPCTRARSARARFDRLRQISRRLLRRWGQ